MSRLCWGWVICGVERCHCANFLVGGVHCAVGGGWAPAHGAGAPVTLFLA